MKRYIKTATNSCNISAKPVVSSDEFFDKGEGQTYWYFTTHGVQPGSVPRGLNIIDIIDKPEGSYFLTDRVLTTDALKNYDIKEKSPKTVTSAIKSSRQLDEDDMNTLNGIVEYFISSIPRSGSWDTELQYEQQLIADSLRISLADAKAIMIEELGFSEDDNFIDLEGRKFYDPEYDRVVGEDEVWRQFEWFKDKGYTKKTFEEFAAENFEELSEDDDGSGHTMFYPFGGDSFANDDYYDENGIAY